MSKRKLVPFPRLVKAKPGETVVSEWICSARARTATCYGGFEVLGDA